jgi:hypothetical protein
MRIDVSGGAGFSGLEQVPYPLSDVPPLMDLARQILEENQDVDRPDHHRAAVERLGFIVEAAGAISTLADQFDAMPGEGFRAERDVLLSELIQSAHQRWYAEEIQRDPHYPTRFDGGDWMARRAIEAALLQKMSD